MIILFFLNKQADVLLQSILINLITVKVMVYHKNKYVINIKAISLRQVIII